MEETKSRAAEAPSVAVGTGAGEVLGVLELKVLMVKYRDGHGQEKTRLAVQLPPGDLYFLDDKIIGKPAQGWVKNGVQAKLGVG